MMEPQGVPIDFSNPSVGVLFRDLSKRRIEEVAAANQRLAEATERRMHEAQLWADRVKDLQARLKEVEDDRDHYKRIILRLAGFLEEVPAALRKKEL
jgi:hypothetical protein